MKLSLAPAFRYLARMDNKHCIVLCTCPDTVSAEKIAKTLVTEKLAACVNIVDGLTSVYVWQGKTESSQELQLIIKTNYQHYKLLENRLKTLHPYELPEIIAVPIISGLPGYLSWIDKSTDCKVPA